jgi:hypothetical protein
MYLLITRERIEISQKFQQIWIQNNQMEALLQAPTKFGETVVLVTNGLKLAICAF